MTPKQVYQKAYRAANKDKLREYNKHYQRKYYEENPTKYLYWQIKGRASELGLPFDLDLSDLIIPDTCPILDIPIFRNTGKHGPSSNSPSVDRINPSLGYVKGNVWIISQRANVMKNDASFKELERFANWVKTSLPSLKTFTNSSDLATHPTPTTSSNSQTQSLPRL